MKPRSAPCITAELEFASAVRAARGRVTGWTAPSRFMAFWKSCGLNFSESGTVAPRWSTQMHRTPLALLAISFSLCAADKAYVLKAAHMFDGKSDRVVSPGLVVVLGGKIAPWARTRGSPPAPNHRSGRRVPPARPHRRAYAPLTPSSGLPPGGVAQPQKLPGATLDAVDCPPHPHGRLHHRSRRGWPGFHRRWSAQCHRDG